MHNLLRCVRVPRSAAAAVVMAATLVTSIAAQQTQAPPVPRPFPQPSQPGSTPPAAKPPSSEPPSSSAPAGTSSSLGSSVPVPPQPIVSTAVPNVPSSSTAAAVRPTDQQLGVTMYPAAEFLDSYDAGRGQRCYIFGTNSAYSDIVTFYKNQLRDGGHEVFKSPAIQEFDLGRFRDDSMTIQPSVVVKDYTWTIDGQKSDGYLFVDGTKTKRFKTIIQIVPASDK